MSVSSTKLAISITSQSYHYSLLDNCLIVTGDSVDDEIIG